MASGHTDEILAAIIVSQLVILGAVFERRRRLSVGAALLLLPLGFAAWVAATGIFDAITWARPVRVSETRWVAWLSVSPFLVCGVAASFLSWRERQGAWLLLASFACLSGLLLVGPILDRLGVVVPVWTILSLATLATLATASTVHLERSGLDRVGAGMVAAALVAALVAAPFFFFSIALFPRVAHHETWDVSVQPDDGSVPFTVRIPFPSAGSDDPNSFGLLRATVSVSGDVAEWRWEDDGRSILIAGRGNVSATGDVAFYGSDGGRMELEQITVANASFAPDRPTSAALGWNAFVPGGGCWYVAKAMIQLEPNVPTPAVPPEGLTRMCMD